VGGGKIDDEGVGAALVLNSEGIGRLGAELLDASCTAPNRETFRFGINVGA